MRCLDSNPVLPHGRPTLYLLSYIPSPRKREWTKKISISSFCQLKVSNLKPFCFVLFFAADRHFGVCKKKRGASPVATERKQKHKELEAAKC